MNNISDAIIGYNGQNFYEGLLEGRTFITQRMDNVFCLFSRDPINGNSKPYRNGYITEAGLDELEDIYKSNLQAMYNGNWYIVQLVSPNYEKVELLARPDKLEEDKKQGFTDNQIDRFRSCVRCER